MKPYLNVDENFKFYLEKNEIEKINNIKNKFNWENKENLNEIKNLNKICRLNKKNILLLNIATAGSKKNSKYSKKIRVSIPGNLLNKNISFLLCFHKKTNLFILFKNFKNSIIVNDKKSNSLLIDYWIFFYFLNYGNFEFEYKKRKKQGHSWVFKEKENLIKILNNEIKFEKQTNKNLEKLINLINKKINEFILFNKEKNGN